MRYVAVVLTLILAAPTFAQVISRPTDPPNTTAVNESWYRLGEPLVFAGDLYYPAGPVVFFDGNVMAPTGHYNGIPLYEDTTIAPYSIVLVPIGRGLMRPYERKRVGELAGTSGSRLSSFPGASSPSTRDVAMADGPVPSPPEWIDVSRLGSAEGGAVSTTGTPEAQLDATLDAIPIQPGRPVRRENVWVDFRGEKWVNAGSAVPIESRALIRIGDLSGHLVYRAPEAGESVIYVETSSGVVVPFRLEK